MDLIIPALIDPHQHLREGDQLDITCHWAARWCDTILAMPNTKKPLTNASAVFDYADQVRAHGPEQLNIIWSMYLTEDTTVGDISRADERGIRAVKAYPRGRTSHSQDGILEYESVYPALQRMQELGMTLLLHGEHPESRAWAGEVDFLFIYDRICRAFPMLRISLEHVTTAEAVEAVHYENLAGRPRVATITAHHLLTTIDDVLDRLDPTVYCKPVPKLETDRMRLLNAATSGKDYVMFGSDSAPWQAADKYKRFGCAGCWTAPWLPQLLAQAFDSVNALPKLAHFAHDAAAHWWGLEPAKKKIRLIKGGSPPPGQPGGTVLATVGQPQFVPFRAGDVLEWTAEIVD